MPAEIIPLFLRGAPPPEAMSPAEELHHAKVKFLKAFRPWLDKANPTESDVRDFLDFFSMQMCQHITDCFLLRDKAAQLEAGKPWPPLWGPSAVMLGSGPLKEPHEQGCLDV